MIRVAVLVAVVWGFLFTWTVGADGQPDFPMATEIHYSAGSCEAAKALALSKKPRQGAVCRPKR